MRTFALSLLLPFLFVTAAAGASKCFDNANVVEPVIADETRKDFERKLFDAEQDFRRKPNDADAVIWLGRRTAYLGRYKRAINIYTDGLAAHPNDARLYRHRGHRYISIRCFDDAIDDLKRAARLIEGKPDEIEPDGLPNERNKPTSTLQSNIWYHLGLAYYLKGDFKDALEAYNRALKVSHNPDMLVATMNWRYATLKRLGKDKQAERALARIGDDLDIIENHSYYKLLKLHQGKLSPAQLEQEIGGDTLNDATLAYGLGNYHLINKNAVKAYEIFRKITNGSQWSSFGYIAAEAELKRR